MTSKKELLARWKVEPGLSASEKVGAFLRLAWTPGHRQNSDVMLALLDGLPFREEVPGGKDLRGRGIGGVRELDLSGWNFSYGSCQELINCNLSGAVFDYGKVGAGVGTLSGRLDRASFIDASLQKCHLDGSPARSCNFEGARFKKCDLRNVDFTGSSFQNAKFKDCSLSGANLRGCDFRGATLDETILHGVRWDKTTDLRGARLLNVFDQAFQSTAGQTFAGADWHQANYDETTCYIRDPLPEALREIGALIAAAKEFEEPGAGKIANMLRDIREQIKKKFNPNWEEDLKKQLSNEEKLLWDDIGGVAAEYLK